MSDSNSSCKLLKIERFEDSHKSSASTRLSSTISCFAIQIRRVRLQVISGYAKNMKYERIKKRADYIWLGSKKGRHGNGYAGSQNL